MKLNNSQRDAFVKAVMHDVPKVNYDEQMKKLVEADCIEHLPKKVQAIAKDKELRSFLKTTYWSPGYKSGFSSFYVLANSEHGNNYKPSEAAQKEINKLVELNQKQTQARDQMASKIKAIIYGCSTLKQARERLPEFVKYLPEDVAAPAAYVPAVSNVVADLVKMGWKAPKVETESKSNTAVMVAA